MTDDAERRVAELAARYAPALRARLEAAVACAGDLAPLLRYHLGWRTEDGAPADGGGKALRPVLCLAACEMAGGDWRDALPAAASLELVHNFSLAHDDIQDGDETRRGRPTLWRLHGVPVALTAGNAMLAAADRAMLDLRERGQGAHAALLAAAADLTAKRLEMIEGQYLDMSFEADERVSVAAYLDMIGRKTGALIESAMRMGALAANADPETALAFGRCGRRLGVAFQARDDYLGVWGDPAATGKAVGADIRRKKKSLPAVYLFNNAPPSDRAWLEETYRADEIAGERLDGVMALLDRTGADAYVRRVTEEQAEAAVAAVGALAVPDDAKRLLRAVARYFAARDR